jgi:hypothetical protein
MNPIGTANKYINLAMEEYGVFDYTGVVENEQEQFGGLFSKAAALVSKHGAKIAQFAKSNPELTSSIVDASVNSLTNSKKITAKGRKNIELARGKAEAAKETSGQSSVGQMLAAKAQKAIGETQVIVGEMRRQVLTAGITDPDVQLEIVRNALAKIYYDKKAESQSDTVGLRFMKKAIIEMDSKLASSFQRRNAERVSSGLEPMVPGSGRPTFEYRV